MQTDLANHLHSAFRIPTQAFVAGNKAKPLRQLFEGDTAVSDVGGVPTCASRSSTVSCWTLRGVGRACNILTWRSRIRPRRGRLPDG